MSTVNLAADQHVAAAETAWTAERIAAALARQVFAGDLVCPNCTWTGHEADLLVVHASLRLIDVEIKLTRADVRADADKAKWWHYEPGSYHWNRGPLRRRRDWPPRIWKHYYAMPADVWTPDLLGLVSATSGVLTVSWSQRYWREMRAIVVNTVRRARPDRSAPEISAEQAVTIARLASLRAWDVLAGRATRWNPGEGRRVRRG